MRPLSGGERRGKRKRSTVFLEGTRDRLTETQTDRERHTERHRDRDGERANSAHTEHSQPQAITTQPLTYSYTPPLEPSATNYYLLPPPPPPPPPPADERGHNVGKVITAAGQRATRVQKVNAPLQRVARADECPVRVCGDAGRYSTVFVCPGQRGTRHREIYYDNGY